MSRRLSIDSIARLPAWRRAVRRASMIGRPASSAVASSRPRLASSVRDPLGRVLRRRSARGSDASSGGASTEATAAPPEAPDVPAGPSEPAWTGSRLVGVSPRLSSWRTAAERLAADTTPWRVSPRALRLW